MVQEFIRTRGVTMCPATGTKELIAVNIARELADAEERRWNAGRTGRKRKETMKRAGKA